MLHLQKGKDQSFVNQYPTFKDFAFSSDPCDLNLQDKKVVNFFSAFSESFIFNISRPKLTSKISRTRTALLYHTLLKNQKLITEHKCYYTSCDIWKTRSTGRSTHQIWIRIFTWSPILWKTCYRLLWSNANPLKHYLHMTVSSISLSITKEWPVDGKYRHTT